MICIAGGRSRRRGVVTIPREAPSPVKDQLKLRVGGSRVSEESCNDWSVAGRKE